MPVIARYAQGRLNPGVASAAGISQQKIQNVRSAFDLIGKANAKYEQFRSEQFMANNAINFEELARDNREKYKASNSAKPDGDHGDYKKKMDTVLEDVLEAAPNNVAKGQFRTNANKLISQEMRGLDAWGRKQNIENLMTDAVITGQSLAAGARQGEDWREQIDALNALAAPMDGVVNRNKLALFVAQNTTEIKYNSGLAQLQINPAAMGALRKDEEFLEGLTAQHLSSLESFARRKSKTNQLTALRDGNLFATDQVAWKLKHDVIPTIKATDTPAEIAGKINFRAEDMATIDTKGTMNLLHSAEVDLLVASINTSPNENDFTLRLASMSASIPKEHRGRVLRQISKNHQLEASMLSYSKKRPDLSRVLFRGRKLLGTLPEDGNPMKKFSKDYSTVFENMAITPVQAESMKKSVRAAYAFNLKETKDTADDSVKSAVEMLLGKAVEVNDSNVYPFVKGSGQHATQQDFEFVLNNMTQEMLDRHNVADFTGSDDKVEISDLENATLFQASANKYHILVDEGALFDKGTNKPIEFNFSDLFNETSRNLSSPELQQELEGL